MAEELSKKRFHQQQFLFEMWFHIIERFRSQQQGTPIGQLPKAKHYYKMNFETDAISNLLSAKEGAHEFLNLNAAQLGMLVPKVRLFKVLNMGKKDEKEIEFPLIDNTDVRAITEGLVSRGAGVGLEKFTWNFEGTHPAEVGKYITAEATLVFQTIEELFRCRGKLSFADLTFYNQKASQGKGVDEHNDPAIVCGIKDGPFYIKADVGWAVPPENELFGDPKLRESVQNSSTVFILQPTFHEIDIDDAGVATLTLKFIASMEDVINVKPHASVFAGFESDDAKIKELKERNALITFAAENEGLIKKNPDERNEHFKEYRKNNPEKAKKDLNKYENETREKIKKVEAGEDSIKAQFENDTQGTLNNWEDIEDKVRENTIMAETQFFMILHTLRKKIFSLEVPYDLLENYRNVVTNASKKEDLLKLGGNMVPIINGQGLVGATPSTPEKIDSTLNDISNFASHVTGIGDSDDSDFDEGAYLRVAKSGNRKVQRMWFFFFGDLIDAILSIAKANKKLSGEPDMLSQVGFILGPIIPKSAFVGKSSIESIADIPIAMDFFLEWFNRTIVKPGNVDITLSEFIRSAVSDLLEGVLRSTEFLDPPLEKQRLGIKIVHVPLNEEGNPVFANDDPKVKTVWNKEAYRKALATTSYTKVRPYMVIFFSTTPNLFHREADIERDKKDGIYHLYPGSDNSLVRNIKYERLDIPGFYESQLSNIAKGGTSETAVVDVFNASIEMEGNTLFHNGDLVYIEPKSLLGSGGPLSAARRLGLAGYYRIVKVTAEVDAGGFSTDLKCIAEVIRRNPADERKRKNTIQRAEKQDLDREYAKLPRVSDVSSLRAKK